LYWSENTAGRLRRARLDGAGSQLLLELTTGEGFPLHLQGVDLDTQNDKVYSRDLIQRADLDGSNLETLIDYGTVLRGFVGIALDLSAGKMYFTESTGSRIQRADLDGANIEQLLPGARAEVLVASPYYVALDQTAAQMYWTDIGTSTIARSNLDGSGSEVLTTSAGKLRSASRSICQSVR
jgi:hypothetical protein